MTLVRRKASPRHGRRETGSSCSYAPTRCLRRGVVPGMLRVPPRRNDMDFSPHAERFVEHYASVRGQVRLALLHEQVCEHVSAGHRVLDVGGGAGHLAARLDLDGRRVVILEPSAEMRNRAHEVLGSSCVRIEEGDASAVPERSDVATFDAVVCHAVAPYVDDLNRLVCDIAAAARPGGVLSVVVKNRNALAMRPALEGRWSAVPEAVVADGDSGGIGVRNKAHTLEEVRSAMDLAECDLVDWYGIRVVSDVLPHEADADFENVLAAERALTHRDPYRALGRLLHVVGLRRRR